MISFPPFPSFVSNTLVHEDPSLEMEIRTWEAWLSGTHLRITFETLSLLPRLTLTKVPALPIGRRSMLSECQIPTFAMYYGRIDTDTRTIAEAPCIRFKRLIAPRMIRMSSPQELA